jgi:hypothetical protein
MKKIINKIKHYFKRNKNMATANYTEAMTEKMIAQYSANPTRETVDMLANELGKNARSVIAKLSREGVYKAQPRVTKSGEPVVRKAELLASIESTLGQQFPSLVKASKADLQRLIDTIS